MELKLIELPAKLPDDFYELPWRIYSRGHLWIPPFIEDQRSIFEDPANFEYREGKAILCYKHGELVGRMVVFTDSTSRFKTTGFFGFFEVIDNIDVTRAMFDLAQEWLSKRKKTKISGPIDFNIFNGFRMITEGHNLPPYFREARNPIFYNEHLFAMGMKETGSWDGWILDKNALEKLEQSITNNTNSSITVKAELMDELKNELHHIYKTMLNKRVKANYFSKISFDEFQLSHQRTFELNKSKQFVAMDNDELSGICLTHFDLGPALIQMNGNALQRFHLDEFTPKTLIIYFLTSKEGEKQCATEIALLKSLLDYCKKCGVDQIFLPITADFNPMMIKFAKKERQYALFCKKIKFD